MSEAPDLTVFLRFGIYFAQFFKLSSKWLFSAKLDGKNIFFGMSGAF
jgi:hypothetical protein